MIYAQFVAKASEMRNAQKSYFRTRSAAFLDKSKRLGDGIVNLAQEWMKELAPKKGETK